MSQSDVFEYLEKLKRSATATEIGVKLGISISCVRMNLAKLHKAGELEYAFKSDHNHRTRYRRVKR